jgi:hypothetical protein
MEEGVLSKNLGVPLVIVVAKADVRVALCLDVYAWADADIAFLGLLLMLRCLASPRKLYQDGLHRVHTSAARYSM